MEKRLLKDLPFGSLTKGKVIAKHGGVYHVDSGKRYYSEGGSSSNGESVYGETEAHILDLIWDNDEWFVPSTLKHIDFIVKNDRLILKFDSLSYQDVDTLAKGIIHLLPSLQIGSWVWSKFKDITVALKNN